MPSSHHLEQSLDLMEVEESHQDKSQSSARQQSSSIIYAASHESLLPLSSPCTVVTEVSITSNDLTSMNNALADARQRGELPSTTTSPMDAKAVVEDFGHLTKLRELRGDVLQLAPEAYIQLRVEVARRIQERDSALDEEETKREATRRVKSYLRSIEHERFVYDAATTASQVSSPAPSVVPGSADVDRFSEDVLAILETATDQMLCDASKTLQQGSKQISRETDFLNELNVTYDYNNGAFSSHNEEHDNLLQRQEIINTAHDNNQMRLNDTFSRNNKVHTQILSHQQETAESLRVISESHRALITTQSENLTLLGGVSTELCQSAVSLTSVNNHLSQVVVNLPNAIQQVVDQSVQRSLRSHTSDAVQQILHAQQQAMLSLVQEKSKRRHSIDYDLLAAKIAKKLEQPATSPTGVIGKRIGRSRRCTRSWKKFSTKRLS